VDRARDAGATIEVTKTTAPRLAAMCARLDGLPLAIELAAVRARLLGTDELLERLGRRLTLLIGGQRDLPDRQQTLRATLDWSHELLDPGQAVLFRRLAVFAGGFTLEAAGAVCAEEAGDALDDLEALVVHSLVRRVGGEDGPARFAMLETIREYALERLGHSGEAETIGRRHAGFFVRFAEPARQGLRGRDAIAWTRRLNAERDNLHAALAWTLAAGEAETGLRLAAALREWWEVTGRLEDGRLWLDRLLATDDARADEVEAAALNATGGLAFHQADLDRAEAAFAAALEIRRRLGDTAGIAGCLGNLSSVASTRGDIARAIALETESLATWREVGDPWGIAVALGNLGQDMAEQLLDFARSAELLEEAVALFRQVGDTRGLAWVLTSAGTVDMYRGDDASAAKLDEALALARRLGAPNETAIALRSLGQLALRQGDHAVARGRLLEAMALFLDSDELGDVAADLELLGEVLRAEGSIAEAALTWGAAAALRDRVGAPSNARDRAWFATALEEAAAALGGDAFEAAFRAGQAVDARAIAAMIAGAAPAPRSSPAPESAPLAGA
jgi:tetratricopeptide (TPR) repeat protein